VSGRYKKLGQPKLNDISVSDIMEPSMLSVEKKIISRK